MDNFIDNYFKKQQEKIDKLGLVDDTKLDINSRLNKIIDECIGDEYNIEKAFNTKYWEWNDMTEGVFNSMFDWLDDFFTEDIYGSRILFIKRYEKLFKLEQMYGQGTENFITKIDSQEQLNKEIENQSEHIRDIKTTLIKLNHKKEVAVKFLKELKGLKM